MLVFNLCQMVGLVFGHIFFIYAICHERRHLYIGCISFALHAIGHITQGCYIVLNLLGQLVSEVLVKGKTVHQMLVFIGLVIICSALLFMAAIGHM